MMDSPVPCFSILIPTWNNLEFLKLCVESIEKNSATAHQILVFVNEGTDGTLEWVKQKGLDYKYSPTNLGICFTLNALRSLVKTDYIVYVNDDMYVLPDWMWRFGGKYRCGPIPIGSFPQLAFSLILGQTLVLFLKITAILSILFRNNVCCPNIKTCPLKTGVVPRHRLI
jgi:glycosyltransferase involved in cell wall biosynthesis